MSTNRLVSLEALARWNHPERGWIAPDLFIAIAEDTGLIASLDRFVWERACTVLQACPLPEGRGDVSLSLNLSARHLMADDLVPALDRILASTGVSPDAITLEITETQALYDLPAAIDQMWALRRLGVRLAIDDFGSGYASLSYLQTLPVETLKIDRSFIAGLSSDPKANQLVRVIVNLAHGFGMRVVAEGVETEHQAEELRGLGADLGQGFHFARPLTPHALALLWPELADVPVVGP
ncbi:MAG: EAL domain-containing protein [Ilumatobacteraceae bacterium]